MSKLGGVDTHLGPEMKSTGEVMGVDVDYDRALTKALVAAGMSLPECGSALLSIADKDKAQAIPLIRDLGEAAYQLHATAGTASLVRGLGYPVQEQPKREVGGDPDVIDLIRSGRVDVVINTPEQTSVTIRDGFHIRRAATEQRIPLLHQHRHRRPCRPRDRRPPARLQRRAAACLPQRAGLSARDAAR